MIEASRFQVRATMAGAYGLDFAAVLAFAEALGAPVQLVAELLPEIEPLIVSSHQRKED